jgi:D-glucuronyl C5-epimerase-like protein
MTRFRVLWVTVAVLGCLDPGIAPDDRRVSSDGCGSRSGLTGTNVPRCLYALGRIDHKTYRAADSLIRAAVVLGDSVLADTGLTSYLQYVDLLRAVGDVADFYIRGEFPDSVRFDRLVDRVAVTSQRARGRIATVGAVYYPARTPQLGWYYYSGYGLYFQPVTTVQQLIFLTDGSRVPLDTLTKLGHALWRYAIWHQGGGESFPRWEYDFPWNTGAVLLVPPWESAMAQACAMEVFTELYRRTASSLWRDRARAVFRSFRVSMDEGGALLPDTAHGYWWEEYHPRVMVWNGSVKALLIVGDFAKTFADTTAQRMYQGGIAAVKYYTPWYDTGSWTYYSLTGYYNTRAYHAFEVVLLDALYAQNQDPWFKATADRWRAYTPPPGVN